MSGDSRAYRFIYSVRERADLPFEFLAGAPAEVSAGVFVPQDDKRWHTEEPRFPACVLLLSHDVLHILTHPSAGRSPFRVHLRELCEVEHGTNLLHGWMRFTTLEGSCEIQYNTRASDALEQFLQALIRHWPAPSTVGDPVVQPTSAINLDLKFQNLLSSAMRPSVERIHAAYYRAAKPIRRYRIGRRAQVQQWPGHLLLATTAGRLLWLRDEYNGAYSPYAGLKNWTRCSDALEFVAPQDGRELHVKFRYGSHWTLRFADPDAHIADAVARFESICASAVNTNPIATVGDRFSPLEL